MANISGKVTERSSRGVANISGKVTEGSSRGGEYIRQSDRKEQSGWRIYQAE